MLEGVRRIGELYPVPETEIIALEKEIGTVLPPSFRTFLIQIGGCSYCSVITTYAPWIIREKANSFKYHIKNNFYPWNNPELLPLKKLARCICIAGTIDGDEVVFHPNSLETFFILPRHKQTIYAFQDSYDKLVEWIVYGGELYIWEDEEESEELPPNWTRFQNPLSGPYVQGFPYKK